MLPREDLVHNLSTCFWILDFNTRCHGGEWRYVMTVETDDREERAGYDWVSTVLLL